MLALIAGNTDLPHIIIKKLYKKKIEFIILDLTSNKTYKNHTNSYSIKITQLDKALLILKKYKKMLSLMAMLFYYHRRPRRHHRHLLCHKAEAQ
jgi:DUF1009 family protein